MADEVVYLVHMIGIQLTDGKVQAITATLRPKNTAQLWAYKTGNCLLAGATRNMYDIYTVEAQTAKG